MTSSEPVPTDQLADVFEPKTGAPLRPGAAVPTAEDMNDRSGLGAVTSLAAAAAPQKVLRLVLVEDSNADAELLLEMLLEELPDAACTVVASLAEALRRVTADVDIVVTDLSLPDAEGLQALLALRAAWPDCPILVMTGRDDRDVAMRAVSAGADDYLVKGAHDARAVATAVMYAVQRRRVEWDVRRFERLALSLLDAVESPTCAVDARGEIVAVNKAWGLFAAVAGSQEDLPGTGGSYFDVCRAAGARGDEIATELRRLLSGQIDRFELDLAWHTPAHERWFSLRINPLPDGAGAVLTHVDVTAGKRAEQTLAHQTMHDTLTGLPNRLLLNDRLVQALAAADRNDQQVGVAFLDLDQFKRINDSFGHAAGDELLRAASERLSERVRSGDTLARFAGDEFVVVWPDLRSPQEADALAERLRSAFDDPFALQDGTISVTASVGVAVGSIPESPDDLLLAADAAMYHAKSNGRGKTRTYTSELRAGAQDRLRTEADLRTGLERGEFVLHYQPVVDLFRGRVRAVEALVRWQHPDGLRPPDSFIPVAEASGLIVPLGAWVLQEACRQAVAWTADGLDLDLAVNLSVRQVSHPAVIDTIRSALAESGLPAHRLLLEVTESAVMEDAEAAQIALEQIARLGASIAIDDFGIGYSSLLYLKRYPVGALKIDRSFVSGLGVNDDDDAIVASVISLARAVGSVCIAEGVETPEQHAMLSWLGCDSAQGYLYGRAVPPEQLPAAVVHAESVLRAGDTPVVVAPTRSHTEVQPAVLARIDQLRQAGASAHTIAAALNRERAPHPQQIQWHRVAVTQIAQGGLPPTTRRRPSSIDGPGTSKRGSRRGPPRPSRHVIEPYTSEEELAGQVADGVERALTTTTAAVVVLASQDHHELVDAELAHRGVDLPAARASGRYVSWDADDVADKIAVDGYFSARLFRSVVGTGIRDAVERHGEVVAFGQLAGYLWDRGEFASTHALEDHWNALIADLPVTLVCGYPHSSLEDAPAEEVARVRRQHVVS